MGCTGARWSLAGAEAVLRLRKSADFDDYWLYLAKEHERTNHATPAVLSRIQCCPRDPRSTLVK